MIVLSNVRCGVDFRDAVFVNAHTATRLSPVVAKSSWLMKYSTPLLGRTLLSPGAWNAGCVEDQIAPLGDPAGRGTLAVSNCAIVPVDPWIRADFEIA